MPSFRIDIPPHVAEVIRHHSPDLKRGIKAALRALCRGLTLGEPLLRDLAGLWKYRVKRFRIVYSTNRSRRGIRIFAVGYRRGIYEAVSELVRDRS